MLWTIEPSLLCLSLKQASVTLGWILASATGGKSDHRVEGLMFKKPEPERRRLQRKTI